MLVASLSWSAAGWAATANVNVGSNFFMPSSSTIDVNDTVTWTWVGNNHSSTSTSVPSLWGSGVHNIGFTFSRQFTAGGSFPYRCTVHTGQNGTITVRTPNTPPTITISGPTDGAVFAAPASFTFAATASDSGGSVTNVQFFRGTTSLANDTTSPYSFEVSGLAAGNYTLSAVASDNGGARATNSVSIRVVTPVPIVLSEMQRPSSTQFMFSYTANAGLRYEVYRSGGLSNAIVIRTDTANADHMSVTDNEATNRFYFYHVRLLPNP